MLQATECLSGGFLVVKSWSQSLADVVVASIELKLDPKATECHSGDFSGAIPGANHKLTK